MIEITIKNTETGMEEKVNCGAFLLSALDMQDNFINKCFGVVKDISALSTSSQFLAYSVFGANTSEVESNK